MELNKLVEVAHGMAKEKGWWTEDRTALEIHALIHSEIAEATEEARSPLAQGMSDGGIWFNPQPNGTKKPCGEAIELADAVIRIADYFGRKGWDLETAIKTKIEYNATRSHRHGGKLA